MSKLKLGIMQPYFFPYVGYFSLIEYSDKFVFFDTPQYIKRGWVNRNRVLNSGGGTHYITVPIAKCSRDTKINHVSISENQDWKKNFFGQISGYKKKAPYYNDTVDFLHTILDNRKSNSLSELNIESTIAVCKKLGINSEYFTFSKMNLKIEEVRASDEWALNITKAMGGNIYVNPPGGQSFFEKGKYDESGIELKFLRSNLKPYIQRIGKFEQGLSIIDVMMFCNNKETKDIIKDYELI